MSHEYERGKTFTDELAVSLIEKLKNAGHICLHEKDFGRLITISEKLEKSADKTDKAVDEIKKQVADNTVDIAKIKTERKSLEKVITFLAGGGIFGGLVTVWGKLFSTHTP